MTTAPNGTAAPRFVTARLPWLLGAGGVLLYLLTLNRWLSPYNLAIVAHAAGWTWRPELGQPLTWLFLYPFHWLPEPWIPLGVNLFTALCAGLTLTLLARSVALLPHDVARDEPFRPDQPIAVLATPTAWLPPLLAVLLCGLQLSFWEHATSASGEMLDLLVFACVIRCLLEFRVCRQQRWLSRAALVYGLGMTNNWAMIGCLPVFMVALLRLKGLDPFLNWRFLLRMALWGLAGLSLYLLLPALQQLSAHGQVDFWTALKLHLKAQKAALALLNQPAFKGLAVVSLLPLLVLSIRWKSHTVQFGDDSQLGVFLTKTTVHFVHGLFGLAAFWLALDPTISPRHLGLGTTMLTYYYLAALVGGYCAGYFLLFGAQGSTPTPEASGSSSSSSILRFFSRTRTTTRTRTKPMPPGMPAFGPLARERLIARVSELASRIAVGAVWLALIVLPLALAWRNLGQIRLTNGPMLHDFARQLYADLPAGKSVVLSDEPTPLILLRAELSAHHYDKESLLLEKPELGSAQYQLFLAGRYASRWPLAAPTNRFEVIRPARLLNLLGTFAAQGPVVFLEPDFDFFFERFTPRPQGLVYCLEPRRAEALCPSPLSNEQLWEQRWAQGLQALARRTKARPQYGPRWAAPLLRPLRLAAEPNPTALVLGAAYAKTLNYWGVQMQRLGHWPEAGVWFHRALELNPNNLAARLNAEYSERHRRGDTTRLGMDAAREEFSESPQRHNNLAEILRANGPVEEPTFLFRTARLLLANGLGRQAGAEFARCAELAPDWLAPKLWLAENRLRLRDFAGALKLTGGLQAAIPPQNGPALAQLLYCQVTAQRGLDQTNEAAACIRGFLTRYQDRPEVLSMAAQLYARAGQFEPDLAVLEELLRREPDQPELLTRKGLAQLQLGRYDAAIATLSKALLLAPSNTEARLRRAVAELAAGQFDDARADYRELLKTPAQAPNALFGLGSIAWRQHDTNRAIEFYQQYLSNAVPGMPQYRTAAKRLKELQRP